MAQNASGYREFEPQEGPFTCRASKPFDFWNSKCMSMKLLFGWFGHFWFGCSLFSVAGWVLFLGSWAGRMIADESVAEFISFAPAASDDEAGIDLGMGEIK